MKSTDNLKSSSSIATVVEVLDSSNYADLIRRRKPGTKNDSAGRERAIKVSYKDLIVLTKFRDQPFGAVAAAVDARLDGAVEQAIASAGFQAKQGETLLVELEERGLGSGNARKVLVIGLGDRRASGQFVYCGLVGCLIAQTGAIGSEQAILPLADVLGADSKEECRRFASILRCRLEQHLLSDVEHGRLKKIRLIVDEASKAFAEEGLAVQESLCRICSNPAI